MVMMQAVPTEYRFDAAGNLPETLPARDGDPLVLCSIARYGACVIDSEWLIRQIMDPANRPDHALVRVVSSTRDVTFVCRKSLGYRAMLGKISRTAATDYTGNITDSTVIIGIRNGRLVTCIRFPPGTAANDTPFCITQISDRMPSASRGLPRKLFVPSRGPTRMLYSYSSCDDILREIMRDDRGWSVRVVTGNTDNMYIREHGQTVKHLLSKAVPGVDVGSIPEPRGDCVVSLWMCDDRCQIRVDYCDYL